MRQGSSHTSPATPGASPADTPRAAIGAKTEGSLFSRDRCSMAPVSTLGVSELERTAASCSREHQPPFRSDPFEIGALASHISVLGPTPSSAHRRFPRRTSTLLPLASGNVLAVIRHRGPVHGTKLLHCCGAFLHDHLCIGDISALCFEPPLHVFLHDGARILLKGVEPRRLDFFCDSCLALSFLMVAHVLFLLELAVPVARAHQSDVAVREDRRFLAEVLQLLLLLLYYY